MDIAKAIAGMNGTLGAELRAVMAQDTENHFRKAEMERKLDDEMAPMKRAVRTYVRARLKKVYALCDVTVELEPKHRPHRGWGISHHPKPETHYMYLRFEVYMRRGLRLSVECSIETKERLDELLGRVEAAALAVAGKWKPEVWGLPKT